MIKKASILIVLVFLLSSCSTQFDASVNQNDISGSQGDEEEALLFSRKFEETYLEAAIAYMAFLNGTQEARTKNTMLHMEDMIAQYNSRHLDAHYKYALYDMNGDGIPELILCGTVRNVILSYYNGELIVWYNGVSYEYPLNNRAILYTRQGAAPMHVNYKYIVLDFYGNSQLEIDFSQWDDNQNSVYDEDDFYLFNDIELTKWQWEELTKPYLEESRDAIVWKSLSSFYSRENNMEHRSEAII